MNWIKTTERDPPFDKPVLVYCRIYGRAIYTYQRIDKDFWDGHWCDGKECGILPPTHWMNLPDAPPIEL